MKVSCRFTFAFLCVLAAVSVVASPIQAQRITAPQEQFGFNIGDDYHLATYTQLQAYWAKLAQESPRMVLEEIGRTAEEISASKALSQRRS